MRSRLWAEAMDLNLVAILSEVESSFRYRPSPGRGNRPMDVAILSEVESSFRYRLVELLPGGGTPSQSSLKSSLHSDRILKSGRRVIFIMSQSSLKSSLHSDGWKAFKKTFRKVVAILSEVESSFR